MLAHTDPDRVPTYRRVLELAQRSFALHSPRVSRVEIPYEGTHPAGLLQRRPGHRGRPGPGDRAGQRAGLHQGAHVLLEHLARARRARHLLPDARPARHRGVAAAAGHHRPDRHRGLGRRPAVDWLETRDDVDADADRRRRLVAGRLLLPPRRSVREALRPLRGLGRQPRLGRRAAPPGRARGRAPGAALLVPRAVGVGHRGRRAPPGRRSSTSPTTCTSTASWRRSPCRS